MSLGSTKESVDPSVGSLVELAAINLFRVNGLVFVEKKPTSSRFIYFLFFVIEELQSSIYSMDKEKKTENSLIRRIKW